MVEVFFATNRGFEGPEDAPEFQKTPLKGSVQEFRVGTAQVARTSKRYKFKSAKLQAERLTGDESTERVGSVAMYERMQTLMRKQQCDVVIFVHGFANSFQSAMERGAELHDKYMVPRNPGPTGRAKSSKRPEGLVNPLPFVFSWPSDGQLFPRRSYFDDRADAAGAGRAMARTFLRLVDFLREANRRSTPDLGTAPNKKEVCGQRIHLVVHSMGSYALSSTIQAIVEHSGRRALPRIFDHVFLMSADEDDDALQNPDKLGRLHELAAKIHVYHSPSDRALVVSDYTKSNPARLGHDGPRTLDGLSDRIDVIDCQDVDETADFGDGAHQYYRSRQEVVDDVMQVLADIPATSIPGRVQIGPNRYRILQAKG
ncbi:MAG: alpha/beta hydrolase [Pseudomonadota bacterium]